MLKRPQPDSPVAGGDEPSNCVAKLVHDIIEFKKTTKYPKELAPYVYELDDDDIAMWYKELNKAYKAKLKKSKTPLLTPVDAAMFVHKTIGDMYESGVSIFDLQGFLDYYGLPPFSTLPTGPPHVTLVDKLEVEKLQFQKSHKFLLVLKTLPVNGDQVIDGGGLTVSVEVLQFCYLPSDLLFLIIAYKKAYFNGDDGRANELRNEINATEEYKWNSDLEILTKMYEIRLRGIVVPGIETCDGIKARDELVKMVNGKCLEIQVHYLDDNKCCVGDVYCDEMILVQRKLPEKGLAWEDPESVEGEEDEDAPVMELEKDVLGMELEQGRQLGRV